MKDSQFSEAVCESLGNYVYRLIDPRNGETFYVGKGKGNRVFAHIGKAFKPGIGEDAISAKLSRIRDIQNSYLQVLHVIHRHGIPDDAIFEVEAALIDAYSGLSNIQTGHSSNDRGPMHSQQIIDKYALPGISTSPKHKLVLININRLENRTDRNEIYKQLRYSWRISRHKAEQADYVLAVVRGVVVGAFEADYWKPATKENFSDIPFSEPTRHAFSGRSAPDEIWDLYVGERGKRIDLPDLKHVQFPIRYWNI